ncbi:hypothetical protein B0T16DRAFT_429343 [Cercophora newfieldiana]|uniref:SH3 domain-containing protein n=1 Tax=Cercophora newfieldiana TaxID=92897 RepID=A0AA39Y5Q4_9PEZI|nr:hypothetical protein B0T16DRAFT_429343 [Cercophora newfieldiana]
MLNSIVRADSIDLQDRDAPNAQVHAKPTTAGLLAPHQAETLREVAAETAEENHRSPRISWVNSDADDLQKYADDLAAGIAESLNGGQSSAGTSKMQAGPQQDALAIAQNGGLSVQEADDGDMDGETEVDMDDDMMDKISSSPSIEDGRAGSFFTSATAGGPSARSMVSDARSCTPYLDHPELWSLEDARSDAPTIPKPCRHHHHPQSHGEFQIQGLTKEPLSTNIDTVVEKTDDCDDDHLRDTDRDQESVSGGAMGGPWATTEISSQPADSRGLRDSHSHFEGMSVPYDSSDDVDDDGDLFGVEDPRFLDSGWGGECLQETEDIDFEFVYALHTFVATVEGQANATKGDTMVLLDDSNSYWWLVRVVKDSSIGYLPAEHIETPTERLARLNKHRNIDLSATMLGDQAEKSRNPLRSAIKRRKTKTVQFAGNTYVDYSEIEYSTEEEDAEGEYFAQQQQQQTQSAAAEPDNEDETAKVEPLKPRGQKDAKVESKKQEADDGTISTAKGVLRNSEEIFETRTGDGPKKTSDGTVRDSFFKDDTVETKKITLTPNLLRDEGPGRSSSDSGALKQRPSLDKLDKDNVFSKDEKKKKDKKEKDKKPSAIRSFFSRKDKKVKGDEDDDSLGKRSLDVDSQERDQEEEDLQSSPEKPGVQRNPSKLQKQQPRTEPSPTRKPSGVVQKENGMDLVTFLSEGKMSQGADQRTATMRMVDSGARDSPDGSPRSARGQSPSAMKKPALRAPNGEVRARQTTKAKSRMDLDEFDSDDDDLEPEPEPIRQAPARAGQDSNTSNGYGSGIQETSTSSQTIKIVAPSTSQPQPQQRAERLSESPVHVSPVSSANPPPLMVDTSSQEEDRSSPRSSPSPELIDHEDGDPHENKDSITTSSSAATSSTWNDVNLRAFFDSGSEIRDLLVVVYDKTDVEPVGPDHPIAGNLFKEQHSKLAEITTQLDNMLGDWLARKQRLRGTV